MTLGKLFTPMCLDAVSLPLLYGVAKNRYFKLLHQAPITVRNIRPKDEIMT